MFRKSSMRKIQIHDFLRLKRILFLLKGFWVFQKNSCGSFFKNEIRKINRSIFILVRNFSMNFLCLELWSKRIRTILFEKCTFPCFVRIQKLVFNFICSFFFIFFLRDKTLHFSQMNSNSSGEQTVENSKKFFNFFFSFFPFLKKLAAIKPKWCVGKLIQLFRPTTGEEKYDFGRAKTRTKQTKNKKLFPFSSSLFSSTW